MNRECETCEYEFVPPLELPCDKCDNYSEWKLKDKIEVDYDIVEHPQHYTAGKFETIEIIRDQVQDIKSYLHGNCIKYLSRYRHKNGVEDLKKCKQYLEWLILECEK